ncbi:VCBS repeat-containing protein [Pseudomonas knackmussii B13]|uniref:VCBS repeat-containing protein n=1 Tax=Pseudomonas knackmussii (strain DSM 6978 / CCUG 54928 / LMG 23759 / B13) TaxID=1301098 RepID=A0A024HGY8_PSEKB|nr:VCBS domain-containing protein [Pseudomonas knackmussii]CDF84305.1 VCBS repeat-containing protein [Pseudomonas knackmussii B13]
MDLPNKPRSASLFRPRGQALALEPRILFDGAAASAAADQQHHADSDAQGDASHPASTPDAQAAAKAPATPSRTLVVVDARLENRDQLTANLGANVTTLVVDAGQDALAAISAALAQLGKVDSIQIFSHGASGQFTLGNRTYTSATLDSFGSTLGSWHNELNSGADIQLYGCDVGAGAAGQALVDRMAQWTGADVGASSNATGSAMAGGDWNLEVHKGAIDKSIALSASTLDHFQGLLADASPTVSISTADNNVLIGDQLTFNVTLSNPSTQVGYGPYIDLFLPATGKDGDDGITFVGATYLGQAVKSFVVTFDANGNATHPLARDASGNPLVITAASIGMKPGDQFVVLELPFASLTNGQPAITLQVTAHLSNLADTSLTDGNPDLTIKARGGFEFGNDSLNNPTVDPSLVEATLHPLVIHPTLVDLTQSINMTEGETATGPNFVHQQTVTVTPATGQTLHNVVVTQSVPGDVQVTAITPGAGGTITSITLRDGSVLTSPTAIAAAIASDSIFITSYSITYDTLSGPTNSTVSFYVPEVGADGEAVIDPNTGNPVTIDFGAPTATGQWTPLDPRDVTPPATEIDFSSTGDGAGGSFVAKAITLQKQAVIQNDVGSAGLSPGDTLRYTLNVALSDYFAFGQNLLDEGQFRITDTLADGQSLSGPLTMTISQNGTSATINLIYTTTVNADGTTILVIDIGESLLRNNGLFGALFGDLAFETAQTAATTAVISYNAVIGQAYASNHPPHSEINEGDSLGNNATVTATVLLDAINQGSDQSDGSTTTSTIPTSQVDITLLQVNGGNPPADGELNPGDLVTFRLSYDLVTGDYENFSLTAYLPLPLLNVSGVTWTTGNGVGQWHFGSGDSDPARAVTVTSGPGNSAVFTFGNYTVNQTAGGRIEVVFTLRVGDTPFADQRSLDVLAQSSQTTTIDKTVLVSSDVAQIVSVAEPELDIKHGVVSSSNGTVTGTTGTWAAPGSGGVPFTGRITDLAAVNGDVSNIDAGDTLRLATAIENTGGGGAYDVVTSIALPPNLSFVGGSLAAANLKIYRGDGTLLVLGTDYSVSGNTITFLDAGAVASLLPGRAGTTADSTGQNIVVITYDVTVNATIDASSTLQTTATLSNYASVEGGTDFTPTDLTETANEQVAAPVITKVFAGGTLDDGDSSAPHTTGSNLVVGESMLYDIVVKLPEGTTRNLTLDDLIPPGLRLDTRFNGGLGYQLILTSAASGGSLGSDFAGNIVISGIGGVGGTLGADGVDAHFTFSAFTTSADNNTGNNSFVIRVRLVVSNVIGNQENKSLQNSANLSYQDPDGDTPNGATPVNRQVNLSGGAPTVTVREPTLQVTQTITSTGSFGGYDEGDTITWDITISNTSGTAGFDLSLLDNLPTEIDGLTITGVTYSGGATNNGGVDFVIQGGQLVTANGANVDIANGGKIVIHLSGVVNAAAAGEAAISNTAQVQWTSLDGTSSTPDTVNDERTGVDGPLNSGVLNDYRAINGLLIPVTNGIRISRIGGVDATAPATDVNGNPSTSGTVENVVVGEIVRYRVAVLVPTGSNPDYQIRIELGPGLEFIPGSLNNILIALLSSANGGLTTDATNLISSGALNMLGNQNSDVAGSIHTDLSGTKPTGVWDINNGRLSIVTNADGSQTITFNLGNLTNNETTDNDIEGVVLEFNARVTNVAGNQGAPNGGTLIGVSAIEHVGINGGVDRGASGTIFERVVEPGFAGVDKQVIDISPGSGTTTTTVSVSFTQNGGVPAYNVHLQDQFPSGSNYQVQSILLNGTALNLASLPAGIRFTANGAISVDFDSLAVGDKVQVIYTVTVPNAVIADNPASSAVLTWTSLPTSFENAGWGGSIPGTAGSVDGERTGQDGAAGLNNYVLSDGAGLGIVQGTLWNDTASATNSVTPDGPGLAGQTVQLTWAGADGIFGNGDDRVFSTVTDASGHYQFALLPAGNFLIVVPQSFQLAANDRYKVRIDTDTGTSVTGLGSVNVLLGEGAIGTADAGYVHQNEAPVNTIAGQHGQEDTVLHLGGLAIADSDAGNGTLTITLTVVHGVLWQTATPPASDATPPGGAGRTLTLTGTLAQLNLLLGQVYYKGDQDYNSFRDSETLTMVTNDQGNFGDANNNGIPGENPGDALSDTDSVQIIVDPVNDAPIANPDTASATEAGGRLNTTPGTDPSGNVLTNDTDVDIATNNDILRVISAGLQGGTQFSVPNNNAILVVGAHGTLVISSAGGATYTVNNDDPAVQALRLFNQTLTEVFTYTISDLAGATSTTSITITIHGANDTPIGVNDEGSATEAGGVLNGTPGSDATGNVLDNDTDVDSVANGETKAVTGIRHLREIAPGGITDVTTAAPVVVVGTYGTLTINANGTYTYVIDNENTAVQRLVVGDQLFEYFTYRVTDAGGLSDLAELRITINGAYDNPVASDDQAAAQAAATNDPTLESNPSGNVILFPSRPGNTDNGVDNDVDRVDRPNTNLHVTGISSATEASTPGMTGVAAGTTSANGTVILATYAEQNGTQITDPAAFGTLTIGADGSFQFDVNSTNAKIQALGAGQTLQVIYTYEITDTEGLTDRAQLVITIKGVNDPPVAQIVVGTAVEKGGVNNQLPGVDPAGDVTQNAFDPDGDPISVASVGTGATPDTNVIVGSPTVLVGLYGTLTINSDGTYSYVLNNADPTVQGLRTAADRLIDGFSYKLTDGKGGFSDPAFLFIVIHGQNDNPVAVDDGATAVEAGGINNNQPGVDPTGNVLTNDSDVDAVANGETTTVSAVRTGAEAGTGTAGTLGVELRGTYGWLTLNADGTYRYRLDNSNAAVQALRTSADQLVDTFTYTVIDTALATDQATLRITITGANDTPVAVNDAASAVEAGGVNNGTPGVNPTGNVLSNDSDVDAGDVLTVSGIRQGAQLGTVGSALVGAYGTLTLNANGTYSYIVDNSNPLVEALRVDSDTLQEVFTYTIRDLAGATATATLTITIHGRNDAPHAGSIAVIAVEAGGTHNNIPGTTPSDDVLRFATDVDAFQETRLVSGVRFGDRSVGTAFTPVTGLGVTVMNGQYGVLTIGRDGKFAYTLNNQLAAVEALKAGETLTEFFTYVVADREGATDIGLMRVTIQGAYDAPVANDDLSLALASKPGISSGFDPNGQVLTNDTDVDANDSKNVSGIRAGQEVAGGALTAGNAGTDKSNGTLIDGLYGQLIIGADGTYTYHVDNNNPTVQSLGLLQTLDDYFTYEVRDGGNLVDLAQIRVVVFGLNSPPVANPDSADATEAGGLHNATPGTNPSGNVLSNDTDLENNTLTVTQIRTGTDTSVPPNGTVGTPLKGLYGTLTLNADGTWSYQVDNANPAVEALRLAGQTLSDVFTYTVADIWNATGNTQLVIVIHGANDTPIAQDDAATAVEAGGVANGTPGVNPTGNVLSNDTDVDSVANGETRTVVTFSSETGQSGAAGSVVQGRYGTLVINADGSYLYTLNNVDPVVQALRTAGETLREIFTYRMRDTAGATSDAHLTLTIQGTNDNPVARDDSGVASDQFPAPQTSGNVLPNDSDVDGGDALTVVGVRTGAENGSGTAGTIGRVLAGRYGFLTLNADGSYTYAIDQTNPEVLAAAGLGRVLQDVFTYTIADRAGATDQAQLTLALNIASPYIAPPGGPYFGQDGDDDGYTTAHLGVQPAIFIQPVVRRVEDNVMISAWGADGSDTRFFATPEIESRTFSERLQGQREEFVGAAVAQSRLDSDRDLAWIRGNHDRLALTGDGLLSDPSLWAPRASDMVNSAEKPAQTARGFRAQLRDAAKRRGNTQ